MPAIQDTVDEIVAAFLYISIGLMIATVYWLGNTQEPQSTNPQPCVPVYYSGLECCKR